ncbi:hypothetical protein AcW2_004349 [Taiwanofungus camphoratus]|nr:hypothetical protein AcW2_004349 [Antrodia cinnamomea]
MQDSPPHKLTSASRKGKEREHAQPTDIAERFVALQRRQAAATKPREKTDRPPLVPASSTVRPARPPSPRKLHAPPLPNPNIVVSHPSLLSMEADADEFSRRLKISATSPRAAHSKTQNVNGSAGGSPGKLYNPNTDTIRKPVITAEPDNISDATSSSYAPRGPVPHGPRPHQQALQSRVAGDRQLFDHRKDDPVRFSVLARPPASPNAIHALAGSNPNIGRPTPTPKSSGDYVSASSTSSASYAQSTISSNFTLSSATTDSSAPSALFDTNGRRSEDSSSSTNAFSMQLKKLYRAISALEAKILGTDKDAERDEEGERSEQRVGVLVKGRPGAVGASVAGKEVKGGEEEVEKEKWRKLMADHKELAEKMHNLLTLTLAPSVPASLRNIPAKYNLIIRLWTHAFHRLLESLRRAATPPASSAIALEHLQDFIYYAYVFYTGLLEERNLVAFRGAWVEALGDLARYRMACTALADNTQSTAGNLTVSAIARAFTPASALLTPKPATLNASALSEQPGPSKQASPTPAARIDDSPPSSHENAPQHEVPSVGVAAARMMELEPEKERWRQIARDWYASGLAGTPGAGKLHHHLGLLSDGNGQELRAVYHFIKSMITIHPFSKSRESVLPIWSQPAQARRQAPDARLTDLFVLLHGMLFTNIQLDDFKGVLERFEEKLQIEGGEVVEEREWIMMAVVNIGAVLEYGRPNAVLKRVAGVGGRDMGSFSVGVSPSMGNGAGSRVKLMAKKPESDEKKMDVDDEDEDTEMTAGDRIHPTIGTSPSVPEAPMASTEPELPTALRLAMQLTFSMLTHTLQRPTRRSSPFARSNLNPYITILLTFLATVLKDRHVLTVLEHDMPWTELAAFFNSTPRRLLIHEQQKERGEGVVLLTSGCAPLPEDWCLRGLGWGGKKVFERGFWGKDPSIGTSGEEHNVEVEVLDRAESLTETADGIIEEGDDDERGQTDARQNDLVKRWVRITRAGLKVAKYVDGFSYVPATSTEGRGQFKVDAVLAQKVERWKEEERLAREAEEQRLRRKRWDDDSMDIDDDDDEGVAMEESSDDSEDDVEDSDEVKALKARRRYLQSLLQTSQRGGIPPTVPRRRPRAPATRKPTRTRQSLHVVPGYTILVVDTNILLSSLPMFSALVESSQWTVVVPLPVIMELDGLATNASPLGEAASAALSYITAHLRSHSISLKVQTSKGNYLSTLSVRTELIDFAVDESWERNMDDLILRAAIWQDEHWVDRSAMLKPGDAGHDTAGAAKVVLLSFDRMLRLKARSRQLSAANEQDLASILAPRR